MLSEKTEFLIKSGFNCNDTLVEIARVTNEMLEKDAEVQKLEMALKRAKQEFTTLNGTVLPTLLAKAKMSSYQMEDGTSVKVQEVVHCNVPKLDLVARRKAFEWLEANGAGDIIKDELVVSKPSEELISKLALDYDVERKKDVNTNSLRAFMADILGIKQGSTARISEEEVPEYMQLFVEKQTKVTLPKD